MLKSVTVFIFKLFGWKITGEFPENIDKAILVAAPHTSNWDYIFAIAYFYILKIPFKYTIKKDWLEKPFIGKIMINSGAIGIERTKKSNMVDLFVDIFSKEDRIVLVVQPEGTRKLTKKWKTGFYQTALKANVPLLLGYLDYKKKLAGLGPSFMPTGDFKKDMEILKEFYKDKTPKNPQNFCLDIYDSSQE